MLMKMFNFCRFLSEQSDIPYYKAGVKNKGEQGWKKSPEGKFISSTAMVVDSSSDVMRELCKIIKASFHSEVKVISIVKQDQAKTDGVYSNGTVYEDVGGQVDKGNKDVEIEKEDEQKVDEIGEILAVGDISVEEKDEVLAEPSTVDAILAAKAVTVVKTPIDEDISLKKTPSTKFTRHTVEEELEEQTVTPAKQSRAVYCLCKSKCLKKPYCSCRRHGESCGNVCHSGNSKCMNK